MAYTPTTWATGDVITADKLNNIEQGIVNAVGTKYIPVGMDEDGLVYGENAYQQIQDALSKNVLPILVYESKYYVLLGNLRESQDYQPIFVNIYYFNGDSALTINIISIAPTNYGLYDSYSIPR